MWCPRAADGLMVKDGRCATIRCVPPCSVSRRPRALLIALAHPFNQSWNPAPAPGPYLLSHQTDPGDPILEFSIQHFLCALASEGRQGQGQGKGRQSRFHRAAREASVSIFASPASGGRSARRRTETRKGERSGFGYPGKDQLLRRDENENDHQGHSSPRGRR